MGTRIYRVASKLVDVDLETIPPRPCVRLVRATHPSHALRHVAADEYSVSVASQDDLIDLVGRGVQVETIAAEQHELPAE